MQTKFKDIAQYYLGTGLKINTTENELYSIDLKNKQMGCIFRGHLINIYEWDIVKPLLRSLDSLTKPITVKGYNDDKEFVPIYHLLQEYCFDTDKMDEDEVFDYSDSMINVDISFVTVKLLCSWHFNIFGLEETEYIKID